MGGSKRSLSALRHALQLFKACLNRQRRTTAGIRLQFCTVARRLCFTTGCSVSC